MNWEHIVKVMEKFWGWQPSEAKALTWSEVREYAKHARIMTKRGA